jgi:predicted nucleic acid-binding Zn ribbon protein
VKNLENVIQELNDQPIQQLETTMDDLIQNEENVTLVLSESGWY